MFALNLAGLQRLQHKPTLASENRTHFRDESWRGVRSTVIIRTAIGGTAFILWFLACLSYVYGALFLSSSRHAAFHVLAVDYDGGVIGQAMHAAYEQLKGPEYFTLVYRLPEDYPTEEDMLQAVRKGDYWAAISASEGASERLSAALQGGQAAANYDPADALHYVWNQQYYTVYANSVILANMNQLVAGSRLAYNKINGTQAARTLNKMDTAATQILLNPVSAKGRNIMPAQFGPVIFLNSVSLAMCILQQFFFLLVLNGVVREHHLYSKMTIWSSMILRRVAGLIFAFGAALCQTGYYWAFSEDWDVNGNQFVLTWMTLWLLMHIHLLIFDSISAIAPLPVMPFVILLWIMLNISSSISPLELQAGFYHWGIALPSHEAYSILVTIWTGGAHNRLYRALPVLFAWWIVGNITTSIAHVCACHIAFKLAQEQLPKRDEETGTVVTEKEDDQLSTQLTLHYTSSDSGSQTTIEPTGHRQRQADVSSLRSYEWLVGALSAS